MIKLQNDKYNRLYKRKRVTLHASPQKINLLHMHNILVYYYVVGACFSFHCYSIQISNFSFHCSQHSIHISNFKIEN